MNRRLIRAAPRPANISTNDDALAAKKRAPDSFATALASSVLPVPGGPWRSMPFGTRAPSCSKRFGERRKSTTSCSSARASSFPATSSKLTEDFEFGWICAGLTCGISFSIRHISITISASITTKKTGSHSVTQSRNSIRKSPNIPLVHRQRAGKP